MITAEKVQDLFSKYDVEGFLNIVNKKTLELSYDDFMKEIAFEEDNTTSMTVTILKENRRANLSLDWFDIVKIENAISEGLNLIEISEQDSDIVMPDISDKASKDFTNPEISKVTSDFLRSEFKKVSEYKWADWIRIEDFGAGYSESEHFYINSKGAYKCQKSNKYYYMLSLVWENWYVKDSERVSKSFKELKSLSFDDIKEIENRLLDKISPKESSLSEWSYIVTLDRDVAADFLEFVISSLNAEGIREWVWLFAGKNIWDKILSENVNIINDSDLENWIWNRAFDSEGITASRFELIKDGVLTSKICDYKNSKKEWGKFLWNSGAFNIVFDAWETSKDFLKDSKFLFTNLMAFHSVDTNTWNFSLNWEGYEIVDWVKWNYVKNIALSWNVKDIFEKIIVMWDDIDESSRYRIGSLTISEWYIIP